MGKIEIKTDNDKKGGVSFKEKRHLVLMAVALVILVNLMLRPECMKMPENENQAPVSAGKSEENGTEAAPDNTGTARFEVKGGVEMGETKLKKEKPALLDSYEKGMVVGDPGIWAGAKEAGDITMEAYSQAVEITIDIREDEIDKIVTDDSLDTVFAEDNISQRGKFFRITGTVEDMIGTYVTLKRSVARKLPLASFVYEGVVVDKKTGRKIMVNGADICEEYIIKRDIEFSAIFAGMKKDWTEDRLVPLFIFKTCERVYRDPLEGVTEFKPGVVLGDPGIWAMSEDMMKDVIEKEPYYHALEILVKISQEDLVKCIDPELNFSKIFRKTLNPRQHRGKVYSVRGRLLRLDEKKANPNRDVTAKLPNTPYVYVGQIREEETNKPYTFRALTVPPNLIEGDFVELTGIYVKVYTYPNRMGEGNFTRTPLIMGKTVFRIKREAYFMETVSIISGVVFIFLLWASIAERKRTREFDQRMKELKERKRKRNEGDEQGKGEGVKGKDGNSEEEKEQEKSPESSEDEKDSGETFLKDEDGTAPEKKEE